MKLLGRVAWPPIHTRANEKDDLCLFLFIYSYFLRLGLNLLYSSLNKEQQYKQNVSVGRKQGYILLDNFFYCHEQYDAGAFLYSSYCNSVGTFSLSFFVCGIDRRLFHTVA